MPSKIKYFLDSNVVIDLFRKNNKTIDFLKKISIFNISAIVFGELNYGIENSSQKEKHLKQLIEFSNTCSIIPITEETGKIYGKIKSHLKKIGKPIPENDIWIAAQAIEHQASLVSHDKHFKLIENLKIKEIE